MIPYRETEDDVIDAIMRKITDCDTFIDIGCGNGVIMERLPHVRCIGIETNATLAAEARRRCPTATILEQDLRTTDWITLLPSTGKTYVFLAWTKKYLADFDFRPFKDVTLITFKHEIPGLKFTDQIKSAYPFNNVYFYG